ncbi:ABC transporter substrate-binding protein [Sphingomicrobium nitratireducens]|uniref:ABC transporter substrate-binding protein n=1 Tax=Sphingomicrobium nitratireducens TaxID=2964666 RepID=UPI0022406B15|nr:hypothetical protein [Sphingomicrobium nitratireducens]
MSGLSFALSLVAASGLRVASADLCADEYALLFVPRAQLVSVSHLSHDPHETRLSKGARAIPANDGRIETLLSHEPDLVITTRAPGETMRRIAQHKGIRILQLPYAAYPDAVEANVRTVARAVGAPGAASAWIKRLGSYRRRPPAEGGTVLWVDAAGVGSTLAAPWLSLAGFTPVPVPQGRGRIEAVLTTKADRLLVSDYRRGQYSRSSDWMRHPLLRKRALPVTRIDGRATTCGGPLMLDLVEALR